MSPLASRQTHVSTALLAWAGYVLLVVAWVMANPPFMAPDEGAQYIRALAVGRGELTGARPDRLPRLATSSDQAERARARWTFASTRSFSLDARQVSPILTCDWFGPGPYRCTRRELHGGRVLIESSVGTYPPAPYLVPGVAARFAASSIEGLREARGASGFVGALLLLIALLACADSGIALAACALAVTPMAIFLDAAVNSSSMEIMAGLCFAAAGLRLIRDRNRGFWWVPMGLSGAALPLSRSAGLLWLCLLGMLLVSIEPGLLRSPRGRLGLLLPVLGAVGAVAWAGTDEPRLLPTGSRFTQHLSAALHSFEGLVKGAVGNFGYLSVQLPTAEIAAWLAGLVVLLAAAAVVTDRRGRVLLACAIVGSVVAPIAFHTFVYAQTGFGAQARHFLPVWIALPLLGGHLLASSPGSRLARPVFAFSSAVVPVVQFLAWYANTHHWVEGAGGPLLLTHPGAWTPPLGVVVWTCIALLGALTLALGHARGARSAVK